MASITVRLLATLTAPDPARDYECQADSVGEALRRVVEQTPRYEQRIFLGERLLVVVAINGRQLSQEGVRETTLVDGDRVDVMLPIAGG